MSEHKLSSDKTWFFTRLLPLAWYGLCAIALYSTMRGYDGDAQTLLFAAIPLVGAVAAFLVMRYQFHPMMDEVYDAGEFLRVIQGNQEHRLSFKDIKSAKRHSRFNKEIIELNMKQGRSPEILKFLPRSQSFSNKPVEDIDALLDRINK